MTKIYHMAKRSEWQAAVDSDGLYRGSPDDKRDGFIHFSTAETLAASAAKHRAGQADLLLITVIESDTGPWKWEEARGGALFPHLYGPLPVAVADVRDLPLGPDGLHVFPPLK